MNRIKWVRQRQGVTQADLARQLGWSQSRIANYEAGVRSPGLEDARRLVDALNSLGVSTSLDEAFPSPRKKQGHAA